MIEPKTVLRTLEPLELLALCHSANPAIPAFIHLLHCEIKWPFLRGLARKIIG